MYIIILKYILCTTLAYDTGRSSSELSRTIGVVSVVADTFFLCFLSDHEKEKRCIILSNIHKHLKSAKKRF